MDPVRRKQLTYLTKIFPFTDIPFGILSVYYSENWLVSLCMMPGFVIVASYFMWLSEKKNFYPGLPILLCNGAFFYTFTYVAGPGSPAWLFLLNITVGSTFMFRTPRIGQAAMILVAILTALFYFWIGASLDYSLIIGLSLIVFVILFARVFDYMQTQQMSLEQKSRQLEERNRDVTDSINYARRIQFAVLPSTESISRALPLSFIYYVPKDIVSGDFYWFHEIDRDRSILVCADCTGHGVPGALMTVIGSNLLHRVVVEDRIHEPERILSEMDKRVLQTLKQQKEREGSVNDGMDMTVLLLDRATLCVKGASAKRPVLFLRNKEMKEIKASKFSIGGMREGEKQFTGFSLECQEDDMIYLFTDGFPDQFGGEAYGKKGGKKYSSKRFRELIQKIHMKSLDEQKRLLSEEFERWKGSLEQVDDVCVIGIRF